MAHLASPLATKSEDRLQCPQVRLRSHHLVGLRSAIRLVRRRSRPSVQSSRSTWNFLSGTTEILPIVCASDEHFSVLFKVHSTRPGYLGHPVAVFKPVAETAAKSHVDRSQALRKPNVQAAKPVSPVVSNHACLSHGPHCSRMTTTPVSFRVRVGADGDLAPLAGLWSRRRCVNERCRRPRAWTNAIDKVSMRQRTVHLGISDSKQHG